MIVSLRGSSPATMVAGILLLSRARSFGQRLTVEIVGDPGDIGVVSGPAILHSAPLASCGVGRELGSGALVVVPGPASEPLAVSLSADGRGDWFYVDRSGRGFHPATQAFVRLGDDPRPVARIQARRVRGALEALGGSAEPAVLDLLFGAPAPPLTRLALALRAGRALTGARGRSVTDALVGTPDEAALEVPSREEALRRLAPEVGLAVRQFLQAQEGLAAQDDGRDQALVDGLWELLQYVAVLPDRGMLPPLDPAMDAVAFGLGRALSATQGQSQAQVGLIETYRFLGGRFVGSAEYTVDLPADLPPGDRLGRWLWFCSHASEAAHRIDRIWRDMVDPPQ